MPHSIKYPEHLRTKYCNGKVEPIYDYTQRHITIIQDGYICTCGNMLKSVQAFTCHKRTITHLLATKQIVHDPYMTLKQQRDNLIKSGKAIW